MLVRRASPTPADSSKHVNNSFNDYTVENLELIQHEEPSKRGDFLLNNTLVFSAAHAGIPNNFTVAVTDSFDVQGYLKAFFEFQVDSSVGSDLSFNTGLSLLTRQNTSAAIAAVADALTLQLLLGPNSTLHEGTEYIGEIYVEVHWPWIIFPGLISVLGAVFLVVSLVLSSRDRASYFWESNLIPLMFHGLSGWDDLDVDNNKEVNALAKEMKTRLARNEAGDLKFVNSKEDLHMAPPGVWRDENLHAPF